VDAGFICDKVPIMAAVFRDTIKDKLYLKIFKFSVKGMIKASESSIIVHYFHISRLTT
jgi:hypothetical protein